VRYVITYDIADDRRREDVATLLSGYGPRVQLSVSGCELRTRREAGSLQGKLRDLIDPLEDQVRVYPLNDRPTRGVAVIGARMSEERQDFWIIT
jgi:CRISPR-associated protein Cas2